MLPVNLEAMYYEILIEKVYLDQPSVKIMWKAAGNILHVEWKSDPTTEVLNEVLTVQRHIIRTYGCTKVVVNNKTLKKQSQLSATL
jgi:hypothetical protein